MYYTYYCGLQAYTDHIALYYTYNITTTAIFQPICIIILNNFYR